MRLNPTPPERWIPSKPNKGIIEVKTDTGRVICRIPVASYESVDEAVRIAKVISTLPELLSPTRLTDLVTLYNSK